ncbi:DUF680 domain-containing protein [Mesorhizobium sp. Cs1299R1N1]|uniref:DUF680 domain-containing protein n=1 Tax=Mesorhizobium salmacidum TaxID=3015171 RepID=A0ABU8KRA2_9HYPH|nr:MULTISPECIES: DUF680 domain-containing protein [unclassified Mesorhizobium]TPJ45004.1 DUF680 domain-containing protein [Mesorhizobium sp. B2-6-5]TPJ91626.1 DUF680 domain-containing protein [Mesorhizobium sp. B2-5-13]TPK48784.1 DUF680 domain-containing protein [Mesorhizobium sp. B2-5-4]TPK50168.1 DUF680 domain-containing protein [Mesorhizobium sp. B2-5-5]TPM00204.1 DUF680 domain-containing protein [Mesorhizobium sp. B2-3-11]
MNKILIAAAAVLAISGSAFASDNYGSNGANQPAAAVDNSYTASVDKSAPASQEPVQHGADRNLFGNN